MKFIKQAGISFLIFFVVIAILVGPMNIKMGGPTGALIYMAILYVVRKIAAEKEKEE